ncbi:MAG: acyl-CoA dehydrogenase family protein [Cyanobacteria bacterium J06656_5]
MLQSAATTPQQSKPLLETLIADQATAIDRDPAALSRAFQQLGENHLLGLLAPTSWGGQAWSSHQVYQFIEQSARYSGALAFLQIQHQRAVQELAESTNEPLKEQYLRDAASGRLGLGVGYSHLRRPQPPITAQAIEGGYCFNGTIPWITGLGIFQQCILAAALPNGQAVFVMAPFQSTETPQGRVIFSDPMDLAAMGSTQTVAAQLDNWFVPQSLVLDIKPTGWIQAYDRQHPLTYSFFTLGCARAGLDVLQRSRQWGGNIVKTYDLLENELTDCRDQTYAALDQVDQVDCLALRAWAIDVMMRCAHAAVTASRGAANYGDHPAQRVYREALAFTIFGQNNDVLNASFSYMATQYANRDKK